MPYVLIRGNLSSYSHKYPFRVLVSGLKGNIFVISKNRTVFFPSCFRFSFPFSFVRSDSVLLLIIILCVIDFHQWIDYLWFPRIPITITSQIRFQTMLHQWLIVNVYIGIHWHDRCHCLHASQGRWRSTELFISLRGSAIHPRRLGCANELGKLAK